MILIEIGDVNDLNLENWVFFPEMNTPTFIIANWF